MAARELTIQAGDRSVLWRGRIEAAPKSIEPGARFWYGSADDRRWVRVVRVDHGIDTERGAVVIELVVEPAAAPADGADPATARDERPAARTSAMVNHGEHRMKGEAGGSIELADGAIIVTVGKYTTISENVTLLTIQLDSPSGPTVVTRSDVTVGTAVQAEDACRVVTCTLTQASIESTRVRITEHPKQPG